MSSLKTIVCALILFGSTAPAFSSVNLFGFWVVENSGDADVHWQTSSETNNDFFVLSRSTDLVTFTLLDTIQGLGTTSMLFNYTYFDTSAVSGETYYYKLCWTDFSGVEDCAPTYMFTMGNSTGIDEAKAVDFKLYPNPTTGTVYFESETNLPFEIKVFNLSGQLILTEKHNSQSPFALNLEGPNGFYLIEVTRSDAHIERIKVLKH